MHLTSLIPFVLVPSLSLAVSVVQPASDQNPVASSRNSQLSALRTHKLPCLFNARIALCGPETRGSASKAQAPPTNQPTNGAVLLFVLIGNGDRECEGVVTITIGGGINEVDVQSWTNQDAYEHQPGLSKSKNESC